MKRHSRRPPPITSNLGFIAWCTVVARPEVKISKALLAAYLCDSAFVDNATETLSPRIRTFIQENKEFLESFFCFHSCRGACYFYGYTNLSNEGTNNGLKTGAAPVLPQHSRNHSLSILKLWAVGYSIITVVALHLGLHSLNFLLGLFCLLKYLGNLRA